MHVNVGCNELLLVDVSGRFFSDRRMLGKDPSWEINYEGFKGGNQVM